MPDSPHSWHIDSDKVYSLQTFCDVLGFRTPELVCEFLVQIRCPVCKYDHGYLVSGQLFRLAVEEYSEVLT